MTRTGDDARPELIEDDETLTLFDWVRTYQRPITTAAIVVLVGAAGWALYARSKTMKAERAERAYFEAQRSVVTGNLPLAQSDLQKVIARYDGTIAADEARIALATVMYEQAKFADGIKALDGIKHKDVFGGPAEALVGAGYEDQGKFGEAARHFAAAADLTRFPTDRDNYRADAARAYMSAGDVNAAKKIWEELAADPTGPVSGEARVRLGELTARPASGKS